MKAKLSPFSRILFLVSSLALIAVLVLPIWRIELDAPQYPEGLVLKIFADKLGGDVAVVNGLNHYIGMRTLHADDFIEFTILPYVFMFFSGLGILFAIINRRYLMNIWLILFLIFAILAMVDFWRWEYAYGHNLDPTAPIQVPGMSYQPPLIGFKQLLNFGAYSIPDTGGWIFIGSVFTVLLVFIYEMRKNKKVRNTKADLYSAVVLLGLISIQACNSGPVPIKYGSDNCDFCKMTLTDTHYGCEIETEKGKIFKFDDMSCMISYSQSDKMKNQKVANYYLIDFLTAQGFIKSGDAFILKSEQLKTPMSSHLAAFSSKEIAVKYQKEFPGNVLRWADIQQP